MKEILLTQGKVALVDDEDFDRVNQFKWHAHISNRGVYYARRSLSGSNKKQRLHSFILPKVKRIDHWDGDGLNCQKNNLRKASQAENTYNLKKRKNTTSRYKGVSWHTRQQVWRSQLQFNRRNIFLGYFEKERDAAIAYDLAAKIYFGEFARINFP